jgi:2-isopropylmalate synthase
MRLTDFKVRIINSAANTAAITRVLIESNDGARSWTTVGASGDIITASMTALSDSVEYFLRG